MSLDTRVTCTQCARPNCYGESHLSENYVDCNNCGIELNDVNDLLQQTIPRDPIFCEICNFRYENTFQKKNHLYSHFGGKAAKAILCVACKADGNTKSQTVIVDVPINARQYKCEDCMLGGFASLKALNSHKLESHGIAVKCRDCPEVFDTINKLSYHRNRKHPRPQKDEYTCRVCDTEKFKTQAERRQHEHDIHRDPETEMYPCNFCEKMCSNVSLLECHLLKHTQKKIHPCDICGKAFGRFAHMEYHRLSHTEQKLFECSLCLDKTFKTAHSLQRHFVRMHSDKPGYACDQCDKVFKDTSDRRRHLWTHGGYEKKFQCDICSKKFFENKALRFHMRSHTKNTKGMGSSRYILQTIDK